MLDLFITLQCSVVTHARPLESIDSSPSSNLLTGLGQCDWLGSVVGIRLVEFDKIVARLR